MAPLTSGITDYDAVKRELDAGTDRAAILIGGSLMEYALEQCLLKDLRKPKSEKETSDIFGRGGIAETFSQKIAAAYFFKIIGSTLRRQLDAIRKIRNIAAHSIDPVSFGDQNIADLCGILAPGVERLQAATNRAKFVAVIRYFTGMLMTYSASPRLPPGDDNRGAISAAKSFLLEGEDPDGNAP